MPSSRLPLFLPSLFQYHAIVRKVGYGAKSDQNHDLLGLKEEIKQNKPEEKFHFLFPLLKYNISVVFSSRSSVI